MNQSARTSRYLPGLDGLRAVAILGIVLYHMFPGAVRGGYLGVTMFFVLSGYLLARTAAANYADGRWRTVGFYQKRIRRIYPALLWVIALTLLALRLWLPEGLVGIREELESILFGYQNWWQIVQNQDYFSRITSTSPFTHMWSLAVELQYYLVWPLLFGLWRLEQKDGSRNGAVGVLVTLALVSAGVMAYLYYLTGDASRSYYGTDARVHALLLGSAVGLIPAERLRCSKGLGCTLFALCAAGYLALAILLDGASAAAYYGLIALTAVLSVVLAVLCTQENLPFGRVLDWLPLKWLGQRSYEIYLTMYPVLYLMERLRPIEDALWRHLAEGGIILALAVIIHALSVPKAWLAPAGDPGWKWFKRPAAIVAAMAFSMGLLITLGAPVEAGDLDALEELLAERPAGRAPRLHGGREGLAPAVGRLRRARLAREQRRARQHGGSGARHERPLLRGGRAGHHRPARHEPKDLLGHGVRHQSQLAGAIQRQHPRARGAQPERDHHRLVRARGRPHRLALFRRHPSAGRGSAGLRRHDPRRARRHAAAPGGGQQQPDRHLGRGAGHHALRPVKLSKKSRFAALF